MCQSVGAVFETWCSAELAHPLTLHFSQSKIPKNAFRQPSSLFLFPSRPLGAVCFKSQPVGAHFTSAARATAGHQTGVRYTLRSVHGSCFVSDVFAHVRTSCVALGLVLHKSQDTKHARRLAYRLDLCTTTVVESTPTTSKSGIKRSGRGSEHSQYLIGGNKFYISFGHERARYLIYDGKHSAKREGGASHRPDRVRPTDDQQRGCTTEDPPTLQTPTKRNGLHVAVCGNGRDQGRFAHSR